MDNRKAYALRQDEKKGSVYLSEDVVANIARLAATRDIAGVCGVCESAQELKSTVNYKRKNVKGTAVDIHNGIVDVELNISVRYGYSIPDTCQKVQTKVRGMVENMTGMKVGRINLRIARLGMD